MFIRAFSGVFVGKGAAQIETRKFIGLQKGHDIKKDVFHFHDKWVPVTTAWRVLRLRMEERPPIWRAAAIILNKQSSTADKGWSSSLGVGQGAYNSSLQCLTLLPNGCM
jgi:hypothetical protein